MINKIYVSRKSPIHDLNFWTKFLCLLLILPIASFISDVKISIIIAIIFVNFLYLSKVSVKKFVNITKFYFIPIILFLMILSIIFYQGSILTRLISSVVLIIPFSLVICLGALFSMVTSPLEITSGVMQIKIPHKYGVTVMVAFRMLPLVTQKVKNIIDAQRARGASLQLNMIHLRKSLTQFTALIIPAVYSTLEMTTKMAEVIISRGYNPKTKITYKPIKTGILDYVIVLFSLVVLVISLLYA